VLDAPPQLQDIWSQVALFQLALQPKQRGLSESLKATIEQLHQSALLFGSGLRRSGDQAGEVRKHGLQTSLKVVWQQLPGLQGEEFMENG